jgi:hypothetical protein
MSTPTFSAGRPIETLRLTAELTKRRLVRPGMNVVPVGTFGQSSFRVSSMPCLNASNTNNVVTYPVWIRVPNEDLRLRPGMTATVYIEVSSTVEVARIPNDALVQANTRLVCRVGQACAADETVRAVDLAADRIVDPTALRRACR